MASKAMKTLESLVAQWPRMAGKDGRSLAEKLTTVYKDRFTTKTSSDTVCKWHREGPSFFVPANAHRFTHACLPKPMLAGMEDQS